MNKGNPNNQRTEGQEITQIIRKQLFCVTDVRVIEILILRQLLCVIGALSTHEGAQIIQRIPARTHYWETNSQIIKMCVIMLGPK